MDKWPSLLIKDVEVKITICHDTPIRNAKIQILTIASVSKNVEELKLLYSAAEI